MIQSMEQYSLPGQAVDGYNECRSRHAAMLQLMPVKACSDTRAAAGLARRLRGRVEDVLTSTACARAGAGPGTGAAALQRLAAARYCCARLVRLLRRDRRAMVGTLQSGLTEGDAGVERKR